MKSNRIIQAIKKGLVLGAVLLISTVAFAQNGSKKKNKEKTSEELAPLATRSAAAGDGGGGSNPPPKPTGYIMVSSNSCGNKTLTRSSNPPGGGTIWYWQTSSSGTDDSHGGTSYTATSSRTYYLRAYNIFTDLWSSGTISKYATVNSSPAKPTTPSVSNACSGSTLTRATPSSGAWYWQTSSSGTSTGSVNAASTFNTTGSGTIYLRARSSAGCWSSGSASRSYAQLSAPAAPSYTLSTNTCGNKTLSANNPPHSSTDIFWKWQGTDSNGYSQTAFNSKTISWSGTYYIRAYDIGSGCWSSSVGVSVTINPNPTIPASPIVQNNCGNTVVSYTSGQASGQDWHWQTSPSGTTINPVTSSLSKTFTSGSAIYVRAKSSAGCWSTARTINYTVNSIPSIPADPDLNSSGCGTATVGYDIIFAQNKPWYWQNSASGTANSNGELVELNLNRNFSSDGTTYVRAYENGCWSAAKAVTYNVVELPELATGTGNSRCGDGSITISATPHASGDDIKWYSTSSGGSAVHTGTSYHISNLTADVTYYAATYNSITGCVDNSRIAITADWKAEPASFNVGGGGAFCQNDPISITLNGSESGTTYALYRETFSTGQPINGTGNSISFDNQTFEGTYTIHADKNSCLATMVGSAVISKVIVNTPSWSVTPNSCGDKTIAAVNPPHASTSVFWKWQGTNPNGYSDDPFTTVGRVVSTSGTYYVRAKDEGFSCWSSVDSILVDINPLPAIPSTSITKLNLCDTTRLTWDADPASGFTWYWQTDEEHEYINSLNAAHSYDRQFGTEMFLRSRNDTTGCWSDVLPVNYIIRDIPDIPFAPTTHNSYCDRAIIEYDSMLIRNKNWYWQVNATDTAHSATELVMNMREKKYYAETEIYVRAYDDNSNCWSPALTLQGITGPYPLQQYMPQDIIYCEGEVVDLELYIGGSESDVSYEVYKEDVHQPSMNKQGDANGDSLMWVNLGLGTYKVVGDRNGCRRDMFREVSMIENVSPTAEAGSDISVFNSDIFMLPQSEISGSVWASQEATIANNLYNARLDGPGTYALNYTFTNEAGCSDDDNLVMTVLTDPEDIELTAGSRFINTDPQASVITPSLTAPSGYNYQWFKDGSVMAGKTTNTLQPNEVGVYNVEIKTDSGYGVLSNSILIVPLRAIDNVNHITTRQLREAWTNENGLPTNVDSVSRKLDFMDDLGRPVQTVIENQSVSGLDMVQPMAYDEYGRNPKAYLPYTSGVSVLFKNDAVTEQASFYTSTNGIVQDIYPYSENTFEASPLNRVLKTNAPGEAWAKTESTEGKPVVFDFSANATNEVLLWEIINDDLVRNGHYTAGYLSKKINTDENGGQVEEFKDLQGRVVLKKVQSSRSDSVSDVDWFQTYYVYDDFSNLRFVLTPKAVEVMGSATPLSVGILNDWTFQYRYDARQRMVEKRVPGADWIYMVYDKRDRLVMTQDGNQREDKEWTFTKYDQLNRPVLTGIYQDSEGLNQSQMQAKVHDYYIASASNSDEYFEDRGAVVHGYTNQSFPKVSNENQYLTVTYYDNYDFIGTGHWAEGTAISQPLAKTYVTGSKVQVDLPDGTYDWNESVTLYDSRYRVASSISKDYQENKDTFVNEYYSVVHPLVVKTIHTHESVMTGETTEITKDYLFDHADRLLKVTHTLDVTSDPEFVAESRVILENEYNELGELITKKLNKTGTDQYSQEVDYQYNIRGWLTKINDPVAPDPEDYFAMQLKYDEAGQYNGNIGATAWKNPFEEAANQYDYTYDPVNRLKSATYNSGTFSVPNIDYDANGNILALQRKGLTDTGAITDWDHLDYDYVGNQLTRVEDSGSDDLGFKDGASTSTEYEYDANGNMISDANKGIESIEYNHLNLPVVVKMNADGSNRIEYIYDATGTKLAQIVFEDGVQTKRTDYQGAFIYESKNEDPSQLQFIQHEEGRIVYHADPVPDQDVYEYQYHLKDHLGNVRATFKEVGDEDSETLTAYMEDPITNDLIGESGYFFNYENINIVDVDMLNSTPATSVTGASHAMRLSGSDDERIGLIRQIKVKPGDKVDVSVQAKYLDPSVSSVDMTNLTNTIIGQIGAVGAFNLAEGVFSPGGIGAVDFTGREEDETAPMAFLNAFVFDEYFNQINLLSVQVSDDAREDGTGTATHETMELPQIEITESGYVYIYLSNEQATLEAGEPIDVFFDDFTVTQHHTPIVSKDDYYPGGLSFNSYQRAASTEQNYKYNGKEKSEETGWYNYGLRQYDPELMMWHVVDPSAERYYEWSPYNYVFNNPIRLIDPDGADPEDVLNSATTYLGTNYEYGGKNPDPRGIGIKNRIGSGLASIHTQVSKDLGVLAANKQWGAINSYYQTLGVQSGCSFGIDCSGLVATAFNADPDKLMGDLVTGSANSQMLQFADANFEGTGSLHSDFNEIGMGDVVFNTNSKGEAKHTMIATGKVKTDKNGNVKKFQSVEATQSGDKVRTKWRSVKSNQKIGHTFRSTDNNKWKAGELGKGSKQLKASDFKERYQTVVK